MSPSIGMIDFFAMEAGDYLERLDALVSAPTLSDKPGLIRLSRALRGSALMAGQRQIASVAGALESLGRAVNRDQVPWEEATRQLSIRAVDDLKILVRAATNWSESDAARAERIGEELRDAAGVAPAPPSPTPTSLDTGTRAFIAREGAAVGNALDQAARSLERDPSSKHALEPVIRAIQPLRGIASLSDLPPLPDLLEGVERAIYEAKRQSTPLANAVRLFDSGARAVSRAAQEIATDGKANEESAETQAFAKELAALFDAEADVVPIESLYHDDDGPHIVRAGISGGPEPLGRLELVSHLENLKRAAHDLEHSQTDTQRELRAHAVAPTLRALASAGGGPLVSAAAAFAQAARNAIASGAAVHQPEIFAAHLREASNTLSDAAQGSETAQKHSVEPIITALRDLAASPIPQTAAPVAVDDEADAFVVSAQATEDDAEWEPIEIPISEPTLSDLADVFAEYRSCLEQFSTGDGTLDELLAGPPSAPAVTAFLDEGAPELAPATPASEPTADEAPIPAATAFVDESAPELAPVTPAPEPLEEEPPIPAVTTFLDESAPELAPAALAPELAADEPPIPAAAAVPLTVAETEDEIADSDGAEDTELVETVLPITAFCYSGTGALRRAMSLRAQIDEALANGHDEQPLSDLLDEVFDLVQLGLQETA